MLEHFSPSPPSRQAHFSRQLHVLQPALTNSSQLFMPTSPRARRPNVLEGLATHVYTHAEIYRPFRRRHQEGTNLQENQSPHNTELLRITFFCPHGFRRQRRQQSSCRSWPCATSVSPEPQDIRTTLTHAPQGIRVRVLPSGRFVPAGRSRPRGLVVVGECSSRQFCSAFSSSWSLLFPRPSPCTSTSSSSTLFLPTQRYWCVGPVQRGLVRHR